VRHCPTANLRRRRPARQVRQAACAPITCTPRRAYHAALPANGCGGACSAAPSRPCHTCARRPWQVRRARTPAPCALIHLASQNIHCGPAGDGCGVTRCGLHLGPQTCVRAAGRPASAGAPSCTPTRAAPSCGARLVVRLGRRLLAVASPGPLPRPICGFWRSPVVDAGTLRPQPGYVRFVLVPTTLRRVRTSVASRPATAAANLIASCGTYCLPTTCVRGGVSGPVAAHLSRM